MLFDKYISIQISKYDFVLIVSVTSNRTPKETFVSDVKEEVELEEMGGEVAGPEMADTSSSRMMRNQQVQGEEAEVDLSEEKAGKKVNFEFSLPECYGFS